MLPESEDDDDDAFLLGVSRDFLLLLGSEDFLLAGSDDFLPAAESEDFLSPSAGPDDNDDVEALVVNPSNVVCFLLLSDVFLALECCDFLVSSLVSAEILASSSSVSFTNSSSSLVVLLLSVVDFLLLDLVVVLALGLVSVTGVSSLRGLLASGDLSNKSESTDSSTGGGIALRRFRPFFLLVYTWNDNKSNKTKELVKILQKDTN